jgi:hypothetical protein
MNTVSAKYTILYLIIPLVFSDLDENLLDFLLNGGDLRLDLRSFVLGDRSRNHWTGDAAGATKS